ncbi:MAG: hypothetical protein AAF221_07030 [Pseudomonadota bacterium]
MATPVKKKPLMQRRGSDAKTRLLQKIVNEAKSMQGTDGRLSVAEFIRQYYGGVSSEDLRQRRSADLAGAALSHLTLSRSRRKNQIKVKVYNPTVGKDGWTSQHSVMQIVTDDRPFLVDSLGAAINSLGYSVHLTVHPILRVQREKRGALQRLLANDETSAELLVESHIQIEFDRVTDKDALGELRDHAERVLKDVCHATDDWRDMRKKAVTIREQMVGTKPKGTAQADVDEACAMLDWMVDEHFTFLGYREYVLKRKASKTVLMPVDKSGLGILRGTGQAVHSSEHSGLERAIRRELRTSDCLAAP